MGGKLREREDKMKRYNMYLLGIMESSNNGDSG